MSRWPVGRGETPRRNGACVHVWQALPGPGAYGCRTCGAQRPDCPHDWVWVVLQRCWSCRVCGAQQAETTEPEA